MRMVEKIIGAIGIVVITIVLLAMTPTVIDAVEDLIQNASDWNFTGAAGAEQLVGLVPFTWIAGILISSAVGMFALAKAPTERGI